VVVPCSTHTSSNIKLCSDLGVGGADVVVLQQSSHCGATSDPDDLRELLEGEDVRVPHSARQSSSSGQLQLARDS